MKRNLLLLLSALLCFSCTSVQVVNLQTEYMSNPLGIDVVKPRFSWQISSKKNDVYQTGYCIAVAESKENLIKGNYLCTSDFIAGGESIGIEYFGETLKPTTRYWWKVTIQDNRGKRIDSKAAWFETGLLDSGWSDAQWIGSKYPYFSQYRSQYNIVYDLDMTESSDAAEFVWGVQDADNYAVCSFKNAGKKVFVSFSYVRNGVRKVFEGCTADVSSVIKNGKGKVKMFVTTAMTPSEYDVRLKIENKEFTFSFSPYQKGELIHKCRLFSIGRSSDAISNIKIYDNAWGVLLFDEATDKHIWRKMAGYDVTSPTEFRSAPMLRRTICIDKDIASVRVYVTSRGIYSLNINGESVSDDYFNPGWTDYRYRIMYNTYDVTDALHKGDNVLGVTLGSGWWADHCGFFADWQNQYGIYLQLMYKMIINYEDGTSETVVSDGKWLCNDQGPVLENGFMNGEDYDARREWLTSKLVSEPEDGWYNANIFEEDESPVVEAYVGSPVRSNMILTAVNVSEPRPGVFVYDMGQNMVGVPQIKVLCEDGDIITLNYGEMIYPETIPSSPVAPYTQEMYQERKGLVYTDNYRSALACDHYVCKGAPEGEVFSPRFTFHGFRYIEIHGLKKALPLTDVKGVVLESIGEQKSYFETSNKDINRLFDNIVWGERGNFLSIPTDCPQRDERMGWMGDAQIFARTAGYNMNVDQFYTRWMRTLRDNQGSDGNYVDYAPVVGKAPFGGNKGNGAMGWTDAGVIVPWSVYLQFGDKRILEEHYESMTRFMKYLSSRSKNAIQPKGGYGDWLAIESSPTLLTNTAYSAYDALLMSKIASILGKNDDALLYKNMYDEIKTTFNKYFVDSEGYTVSPTSKEIFGYDVAEWFPTGVPKVRNSSRVHTQTSYVVPMRFGLFDDSILPLAQKRLVEAVCENDTCLTTGFIGTPYLNLVLSNAGYDDVAYALFEQTAYPSWLYPVLQGATTIWERWNSYTLINGFGPVDMNSFNHYSYGAIQEWMFSYMLGIEVDENNPGYKHIILQPRVGGSFSYARGGFETPYGMVESAWTKLPEGKVKYNFTIPANTIATLKILSEGQMVEMELVSGKYEKVF